MMRIAQLIRVFLLTLIINGCIEPYDPPLDNKDINLLVVDGFLDATGDSATVSLTRTLPVKSAESVPVESGAEVWIESDEGSVFALTEFAPGLYQGDVPGAGTQARYSLRIRTAANREYASEFVTAIETPAIDSITYAAKNDGLEIAVNTHDETNLSRNYRWSYVETYEYRARFNSIWILDGDVSGQRPSDQSIHTCWKTDPSTGIIVASTKHLETSVVSKFPLTFIDGSSKKISVTYSLLVRQQALTDEAYEYWMNLERTTENLGGLFDPLPSEVQGNVSSITNPGETVIGLFGAGTVQEKRIFIDRDNLPPSLGGFYRGDAGCALDTLYNDELDQFHPPSAVIVAPIYVSGVGIIGYTTTTKACGDCRAFGGTTVMPNFWE